MNFGKCSWYSWVFLNFFYFFFLFWFWKLEREKGNVFVLIWLVIATDFSNLGQCAINDSIYIDCQIRVRWKNGSLWLVRFDQTNRFVTCRLDWNKTLTVWMLFFGQIGPWHVYWTKTWLFLDKKLNQITIIIREMLGTHPLTHSNHNWPCHPLFMLLYMITGYTGIPFIKKQINKVICNFLIKQTTTPSDL